MANVIKMVVGSGVNKIAKDSDKDGVIDVLDCRPFNPRKQGWIHEKIEQLTGNKEVAEKLRAERMEEKYVRTTKTEEAAKEERLKQELQTAKFREQRRGELRRKSIGSGGILGQVSSAIKSYSRPAPMARQAGARRKVTKYVKTKGGKYKKVTSYKPSGKSTRMAVAKAPPRQSMADILGGAGAKSKRRGMLDFKF